jgi:ADP-ribosyl-[dinitrogen reductase] hydrolase
VGSRPVTDLASRLAGAVWGHLVGDALGVPYEFRPPEAIVEVRWGERGTHGQRPGTWSDDGGLMLALLDSLLSAGFDLADQASRALAWRDAGAYRPGERFDIGTTTDRALSRAARGVPPMECGGTDESDNGNGSLMRILPIALTARDEPEAVLVERAMQASSLTHAHGRSQLTCALYTLVARHLLLGVEPPPALAAATAALEPSPETARELSLIHGYGKRTGSGYVVDTFWSAWDALAGGTSYRDTVERAIRFGNDTDTTACVAGGLAGARWGLEAIPSTWLSSMRGRALVEPLVARLVAGT